MANTKKPVTDNVIEAITEETQKPKVSTKKTPKKYSPDDRILCRSVTSGELVYVGTKSKLYYHWMEYGDTCEIEYADLQALASMKSRFLVDPLFIIEDEELVSQWNALLGPIYSKIDTEGIDDIFNMQPKEFKNALINAPKGLQNAIKTRAVKMINTQELYDVRKIKAIDEVLGTEFASLLLS